jgi:hypothetical protein
MVEMTCEEHDRLAASSQFITHTVGRVLGSMGAYASCSHLQPCNLLPPSSLERSSPTTGHRQHPPAMPSTSPQRTASEPAGDSVGPLGL